MAKKNKMHSVQEKKIKNLTLKGGYVAVKLDNIHQHLQEVNRGCGVKASKTTYNRKKNSRIYEDNGSSFFMQ